MTTETMGERISAQRIALGLKQVPFAKRAKISQGTLSSYESDSIPQPKAHVVFKIANALGVNPEWLFTGKGMAFGLAAMDEQEATLLGLFRELDEAGRRAVIGAAYGNATQPSVNQPYKGIPLPAPLTVREAKPTKVAVKK